MRCLARPLTVWLLAALGGACALRDWLGNTSASESETVTWGATDPTWSPDSRRLAFSLFGSLWQTPAGGGEAQQITNSYGYHAHPAWSPNGDKIAFIRGDVPAGRIPNVPGKLVIVDVASGVEREIVTPAPVAGTLAWSPDGGKIACALRLSEYGALLHEITVSDGSVRQIQQLP